MIESKKDAKIIDHLYRLVWERYFYLEKKVFEDNCKGMTEEESDSAIEEMYLIFNNSAPYILGLKD